MADLPDDVRELLAGTNFAHVATVLPDGAPALGAGVDRAPRAAGRLLHPGGVAQGAQPRARPARGDLVVDRREPVPLGLGARRGRPRRVTGEAALEMIDRMARKYTRRAVPDALGDRLLVEPTAARHFQLPFEAPQ